ncbi:transcriptional regulator [Actinoplanes cyaneus]|uniref:Transcriptional regulator n=1 Tax=Actinoplanes cyaneus TaxID=52696 RepID=A0A919M0S5_9ACTN|nr:helix-turn-helix domain-containing protein [Actinoplanes cyaneus]MCW2140121.1 transcriptional regulator, HxlR family [Actinoplanes cyaneus]GID65435.1 transcriptional regulator [Actinoplanes cyaneus]
MAIRLRPGSRLPVHADTDCPTTCPTRQTLSRLADRWTLLLVESLAGDARRFAELRAAATGISEKMLAQTLRSLERDGLVRREVLPGVPPGARYHLTDLGRSLLEPLEAVRAWGRRHMAEVERARLDYDAR